MLLTGLVGYVCGVLQQGTGCVARTSCIAHLQPLDFTMHAPMSNFQSKNGLLFDWICFKPGRLFLMEFDVYGRVLSGRCWNTLSMTACMLMIPLPEH